MYECIHICVPKIGVYNIALTTICINNEHNLSDFELKI